MRNTIYTTERVRAIVEETRLNANPSINPYLHSAIGDARRTLHRPEMAKAEEIENIENALARCQGSYAAKHYHQELLLCEAERIRSAQDVFELHRVARLIRDLGEYKTNPARKARAALDDLWKMVQDAREYAQGLKRSPEPKITILVKALRPYAQMSDEVSGIHHALIERFPLLEEYVLREEKQGS